MHSFLKLWEFFGIHNYPLLNYIVLRFEGFGMVPGKADLRDIAGESVYIGLKV